MAPVGCALSPRAYRDICPGRTPPGRSLCDLDLRDRRLAEEAGVSVTEPIAFSRHAHVLSVTSGGAAMMLKIATPTTMADPIGRCRFAREARVGLVLRHPHLVRTLRHGADWILLQDARGPERRAPSLLDHVRDASPGGGPLAVAVVEDSVATIAGALAHMHAKGFVHRDVKPGNILVDADGRAVLIDLGAVGLVSNDELDDLEVIGSPAWMAPEQIAGGSAHPAADVWSLAMVAAFALVGASAYEGSATDVLRRRREESGVPDGFVERALSRASPRLRALILSSLSVEAGSRPPARAFARPCGPLERSHRVDLMQHDGRRRRNDREEV